MVNLEALQSRYSADYVFYNEGELTQASGDNAPESKTIKQMIVVLKQSIDAAEIDMPQYIEFASDNSKIVFVFTETGIYGLNVPIDTAEIAIIEEKKEEEKKEEEKQPEAAERKKIKIKSKKEEEAAADEPAEKPSAGYVLDSSTVGNIEKIAEEYLEDFAGDILSNLMDQVKIDKDNPTADKIDELLKKLNKSSSLIIGPSHAEEMIDKIKSGISG
ncbi:MAG: hypothetical protein R6U31_03250 [bacterium]